MNLWCIGCDDVHDERDMRWTPRWMLLCRSCVRAQCTHGANGVWIPACTSCGNYWNEECHLGVRARVSTPVGGQ